MNRGDYPLDENEWGDDPAITEAHRRERNARIIAWACVVVAAGVIISVAILAVVTL